MPGKLPVPGRPTIWTTVGQGHTALAVGAGGGCLDIFTLIYPFSPLSPSLWETARYRLKYCLKGPLNPKQPTNQPKKDILVVHKGIGMLKLGRMHRQTRERFVDPTAMLRQMREVSDFLKQPSTDNHPWPSQTIQKMDMKQPRWEIPQPD